MIVSQRQVNATLNWVHFPGSAISYTVPSTSRLERLLLSDPIWPCYPYGSWRLTTMISKSLSSSVTLVRPWMASDTPQTLPSGELATLFWSSKVDLGSLVCPLKFPPVAHCMSARPRYRPVPGILEAKADLHLPSASNNSQPVWIAPPPWPHQLSLFQHSWCEIGEVVGARPLRPFIGKIHKASLGQVSWVSLLGGLHGPGSMIRQRSSEEIWLQENRLPIFIFFLFPTYYYMCSI